MVSILPPRSTTTLANGFDYFWWRGNAGELNAPTRNNAGAIYGINTVTGNAYGGYVWATTTANPSFTFGPAPLFRATSATGGTCTLSHYMMLSLEGGSPQVQINWNGSNIGPGISITGFTNNLLQIQSQGSGVSGTTFVNLTTTGSAASWYGVWLYFTQAITWTGGATSGVPTAETWSVTHPTNGTFSALTGGGSQNQQPPMPVFSVTGTLTSAMHFRDVRIDYS